MKILALIAFTLIGCGSVPTYETKAGCLTFKSWEVFDSRVMTMNVAIAEEIMRPFVGDKFCESFKDVNIEIRQEEAWRCENENDLLGPGCIAGWTDVHHVELNRSATALVHELFHVWDIRHVVLNTGDHPHWEPRGWWDLDQTYIERAQVIYPGEKDYWVPQ